MEPELINWPEPLANVISSLSPLEVQEIDRVDDAVGAPSVFGVNRLLINIENWGHLVRQLDPIREDRVYFLDEYVNDLSSRSQIRVGLSCSYVLRRSRLTGLIGSIDAAFLELTAPDAVFTQRYSSYGAQDFWDGRLPKYVDLA